MKHNHTNKRVPKSGTSPWARYNKRPTVYSPAYQSWFRETTGKIASSERKEANARN